MSSPGEAEAVAKIEKQETKVKEAEAKVEKAKGEVQEAETKVEKAESKVKQAESRVKEAEAKIEKAKEEVKEAKKEVQVTQTGGTELQKEAAQKGLDSAQKGLDSAQKGLDSAQKGLDSAQKGLDSAQEGVKTAQRLWSIAVASLDRASGGAQAASGQGAIATPTGEMHILVKAKIFECKSLRGIRAAVYMMAQRHRGRYNSSPERTICYSQNDLEIAVAFPQCRRADAERFLSSLDLWHLDSPLLGLRGKVIVERDMSVVLIRESRMIMLSDYVATESESPLESLEDFKALPASDSSATSEVSVGNTLCSFQSLEKPECFGVANAYKMHLKDRAKFSDLRQTESNILVGSWTPCHQFLDGLNTADNLPQMAVGFLRECDDERVGFPPQKRSRIDVVIEFRSEEAERQMAGRFKDGSRSVGDLKWESFVHVEDKGTFMECLKWKYDDTKRRWKEMDEM